MGGAKRMANTAVEGIGQMRWMSAWTPMQSNAEARALSAWGHEYVMLFVPSGTITTTVYILPQ